MILGNEKFGLNVNWKFECFDKNGDLKWKESGKNLVVTEGFNTLFDTYFNEYTQIATWYIGLKGIGVPADGDTLASHSTWTENTNYTGDRKQFVTSSAASASLNNTASKATFVFTADAQTIAGGFICSAASGTTGTLFSVKDFTGGNKSNY